MLLGLRFVFVIFLVDDEMLFEVLWNVTQVFVRGPVHVLDGCRCIITQKSNQTIHVFKNL